MAEIVRDLFRSPDPQGPLQVGLEAEVLPVAMADGAPVHPFAHGDGPATVPVLRRLARHRGWREEATATGVPRYVLDDGSRLTFEPGGQIEYATRAHRSLDAADGRVREILLGLSEAMEGAGVRLLARGIDPGNPLEAARLVLEGERYPRQRAHYDRKGPHGRTMMLQTAALHLNLDLGPEPAETWAAANTLTPLLVALFANAPVRPGASEPHRSHRAALWRRLDPSRTSVFGTSRDPWEDYLRFALDAESFLLGAPGGPPCPFSHWLQRGASSQDFGRHLTTLFPEVRPRGYLEIRSVDALPARWCIVPAAVTFALVHHPPVRRRVLAALPPADLDRLERAGRLGLSDPELAEQVASLRPLVEEGLDGLGPAVAGPPVRSRVEEFFAAFTARGRDPGHHPGGTVAD